MAFGADDMQTASPTDLLLLLAHDQVVFGLDAADHLAHPGDFRIVRGGLFSRLGNAIFEFEHREAALTPGLDEVAGQCREIMLGLG